MKISVILTGIDFHFLIKFILFINENYLISAINGLYYNIQSDFCRINILQIDGMMDKVTC